MSGHTTGPWHWVDDENDEPWDGSSYLSGASLRTVEEFGENKTQEIDGKSYTSWALPKFVLTSEEIAGDSEAIANARVLAAAPDLLSALIDMVDDADDDGQSSRSMVAFARAAIAKATQP